MLVDEWVDEPVRSEVVEFTVVSSLTILQSSSSSSILYLIIAMSDR